MDFSFIGLDWGNHREEWHTLDCELKRRWSSLLVGNPSQTNTS